MTCLMKRNLSKKDAEEEPYFRVPQEARWTILTAKTENIGEALDKAFAAIEKDNTQLEGVMTAIKFGDYLPSIRRPLSSPFP